MPLSEFRDYLEAAAKKLGSKRKLAAAIGLSAGRLSRVLAGEHSFEPERCFVLAKVTGDSPLRILRLAGKAQLADQIEDAYGPGAGVKPAERAVLDRWDALEAADRAHLEGLLATLAAKKPTGGRRSSRTFRRAVVQAGDHPRKGHRPR